MLDSLYENFTLNDIFYNTDLQYLILKVSPEALSLIFNAYSESIYEFKFIIPWIKSNFDDNSMISITNKLKKCVDYIIVFQRSGTRNIKSFLSSIVIETDKGNELNNWEKNLIINFSSLDYNGIIITQDGFITKTSDLISTSKYRSKINLFEEANL